MMARAPLVLETHGKITRNRIGGVPTARTRYRDTDGITRKVQRTGRTLAEAEQNLKQALKARHIEVDKDAILTRESTINQLVEEWLEEARASGRYASATLRTYAGRSDSTIKPGIGEVRLRETSVSMLDRFIKLTIKNHGPGTARTIRSVLSNAFALAVRHGLTDFNYAQNTAPVPRTKSVAEAPGRDTIYALVQHLRAYDEALVEKKRLAYLHDLMMMYIATGARTAEILALKWGSVALADNPPKVGIEATLVVGEDGKLTRQEYTKNDAGMRRLSVPRSAADMLHRRRVDSYGEIVFPSSTGTYRWPHNLRRDWRDAINDTQFEGMTPKSFRKAVATLLRDEMSIEVARDQLGHSDAKVTSQHYATPLAEGPDATVALETFFKAPSKR